MKFVAEYIWLAGDDTLRSKSRTVIINCEKEEDTGKILQEILSVNLYEEWNYDGSSCGFSSVNKSDIVIKPVAVF